MAENTTAVNIVEEVRSILRSAATGKGTAPTYLTAYQILDRLPPELREQLITERGRGGRGEGHKYAAPSVVMEALKYLQRANEIDVSYIDTDGLRMLIDDEPVVAGNRVCAIYRSRV